MSQSANEYIDTGLNLLQEGLLSFVERLLKSRFGSVWKDKVTERLKDEKSWDSYGLLRIMNIFWKEVFSHLKPPARSYVNETIATRGRWARRDNFSIEDIDRALDTMRRLLEIVGSHGHAEKINALRKELSLDATPTAVPVAAASTRILRDLRSSSPPLAPAESSSSDSSRTNHAHVPYAGKLTVKQVACDLLCATVDMDGQQFGLPLDEILEKVGERLPEAKTTRNSLNIYQSQIRNGKHGYERWAEKLPSRRLRSHSQQSVQNPTAPSMESAPDAETALKMVAEATTESEATVETTPDTVETREETTEIKADMPDSRFLAAQTTLEPQPPSKHDFMEFACNLLCTVDETGRGLSYEEIIKRLKEKFPKEDASAHSLHMCVSRIKRGVEGFSHWAPKLPEHRTRA